MGKIDIALKTYFSNSERFADFINGALMHGRCVLRAEELTDDSPIHGKTAKEVIVERMSDVAMKQLSNGSSVALIFMQNQMKTDYGMPIRVLFNEALEYDKQYRERQSKNRSEWRKKLTKHNKSKSSPPDEEYLSGLTKNDRFMPVITVVVYWGKEEWEGPKNLKELLDFSKMDKELEKYVAGFPLNLVHIDEIENLECFHTDVRHMLGLRKCRNHKEEFRQYVENNREDLARLDMEAATVIAMMSDDELWVRWVEEQRNENREEFNMCKALDDMRDEAKAEGRTQGVEQTIKTFVTNSLKEHNSPEQVLNSLKKYFNLTENVAQGYLK